MLLCGAETDKIVDLTPRAQDRNSVRACGGNLEDVKAAKQYTRRYVFQGGEILKNMEFCSNGKIAVSNKRYRIVVPQGEEVVAWISKDGTKGVIEGCINGFEFETPVPPEEQPEAPPASSLPPLVMRDIPSYMTPPWNPPVPNIQPPHNCPHCAAIVSDYLLGEMDVKNSKPINVWAVIEDGTVVDGIWKFNGVVVGHGTHILLNPRLLYDAANRKAGKYFLQFIGKDEEGHVVACGLEGTPIELRKKGRNWVLAILNYIPCVRQVIHPEKMEGLGRSRESCLHSRRRGGMVLLAGRRGP